MVPNFLDVKILNNTQNRVVFWENRVGLRLRTGFFYLHRPEPTVGQVGPPCGCGAHVMRGPSRFHEKRGYYATLPVEVMLGIFAGKNACRGSRENFHNLFSNEFEGRRLPGFFQNVPDFFISAFLPVTFMKGKRVHMPDSRVHCACKPAASSSCHPSAGEPDR